MKAQVLDEAIDDLAAGYRFYQQQAERLGSYFLDTLLSDIQSLSLYAGVDGRRNPGYILQRLV